MSVAGDDVTVGCSTTTSAPECLYTVRDMALSDKRLAGNLEREFHVTLQIDESADSARSLTSLVPRGSIVQLPVVSQGLLAPLEVVIRRRDLLAMRADIGGWSWQWDDLSTERWPDRWAFGGLAERSNFDPLAEVLLRVGDPWVQHESDLLIPRARSFLGLSGDF